MRRFYLLYADSICPQPVGKITMDEILMVPWGHHRSIMDKCKGDTSKAQFYVRKIIKNN